MGEMWINMGPQHPMTHGLWNLRIRVSGETIVDAEPEIGYIHRGVERISEKRTYEMVIPLADRLCYASSITWAHNYVAAVENLMGVDEKLATPDHLKIRLIRVLSLELQRVASHLMWFGAFVPDLGLFTGFLYMMRDRELFLDLIQALTGARLNQNFMRIGGTAYDLPSNFDRDARKVIKYLRIKLDQYTELLNRSRIWRIRLEQVGKMTKREAINWGVTGINLRATGVDWDLRRDDPYEAYPEVIEYLENNELESVGNLERSAWLPPVRSSGDCLARFHCRVDEIWYSLNLIEGTLDLLKDNSEGPHRIQSPIRGEGTGFARTEDSRGEALSYVVGDGGETPYRWHVRSPMFVTVSAIPALLIGNKVADVPAVVGSIDMCLGEVDK